MEDDDLEFGEEFVQLKRFPGSHLSSPLTYYPQRLLIKYFEEDEEAPIDRLRGHVEAMEGLKRKLGLCSFIEDPSEVYSSIFSYCNLTSSNKERSISFQDLRDILVSCTEDTKACYDAVRKHHPALSDLIFKMTPQDIRTVVTNCHCAYYCYKFTSLIRTRVQIATFKSTWGIAHGPESLGGLHIYYDGEILFCQIKNSPPVFAVLNFDQWLMICDTVTSRFLALLTCEMNELNRYDVLPSPRLLRQLYKWGDDMIKKERMPAYAVIGEFESLITSVFVTFAGSDPLGLGEEYSKSVIETATEIYSEYNVPVTWTVKLLELMRSVSSVNVLSELFGLRKHWGNPMVEAAASGRAVQMKLNEELPISGLAHLELLASFNRMITLSYMKIHHVWPKCYFHDRADGSDYPLKTAWSKGVMKVPERNADHKHIDWALLQFECNCTVDTYENQLAMLTDKSVSLPVEDLDHVYIKGMKPNQPKDRTEHERRLILEFLRTDHLSVMEIFKKIMTDDTPYSWYANSASMKGTEVKHEKARIFAVLTFELRQFFAVTEDMIKTHLFPYNPHQTMTMGENDLLTKLREITKQMDPDYIGNTLNVMHIVDFSKWNLRMRYENTCLVFKSMDSFLGFPGLIERSHPIFEAMVNLVQDAYNPPDGKVEDTSSDTIWRFHNRGWEGQRQKGWTILTSALLSDLERVTGVHSTICGQGDNQILLSRFPIPHQYKNASDWIKSNGAEVKRILDDYYANLEVRCGEVGLKVKTAETCRSLQYLNYGKRLFFGGVELSMSLKRISKAMTESNDAFPTSEVRLKTSQGASYAAGLYSHPSPWPYLMSRICTSMILWESFYSNPLIDNYGSLIAQDHGFLEKKYLSIISKMPSCFGGPPQQSFASFLCRGHPDPLSEDLAMLCLRARNNCGLSRSIIQCAVDGVWFNNSAELKTSLILSPFSLNLCTPTSAKAPVARAVLPALQSYCRNKSVESLLSFEVDQYEERLLESLSRLAPFNPIIANDIFSRSVVGQRQNFVNGLKNATSICRLISEDRNNPMIKQIIELEQKQLQFWLTMVEDVLSKWDNASRDIPLHHVLAQELRVKCWGADIVGVTVPHPIETYTIVESSDDICEHHTEVEHPEHLVMVRHSDGLFSPVGSDSRRVQLNRSRTGKPYLGSRVSEGIVSKQIVCKTATPSWIDACRLNVLRHWLTEPDSDLDDLLQDIIGSRTDSTLAFLDMATGKPSRLSYTHRASLLSTKKTCAVTTTSNMFTRIYTSSNRMGKFSSGDLNYHLPYGPAFITLSQLLCQEEVLGRGANWLSSKFKIFHCHLYTNDIPVVYDGRMDLVDDPGNCRFPVETPSILFSGVEDLEFEDLSSCYMGTDFKDFSSASIFECKVAYGAVLLGDMFMKEISSRELLSAGLVGMYPRRESSVSVGDLKLTGLTGLIRAISVGVLLVLDIDQIRMVETNCFVCLLVDFLKGFSSSFWNTFTSAMLHANVIKRLRQLARECSDSFNGLSLESLDELLQIAVASDVQKLIRNLRISYPTGSHKGIILVAPSFNAARHLYAKYCEICVWIVMRCSSKPVSDAKKSGRIMSKLVHSQDKMADCVMIASTFLKSIERLLGTNYPAKNLARIHILNLADPWIDRLRDIKFSEKVDKPARSRKGSIVTSLIDNAVAYHIMNDYDVDNDYQCPCHAIDLPPYHRMEGFFIRSGPVEVNSIVVRECVARFNLEIESVLCLNDFQGNIGASFAEMAECLSVYVCPCKTITSYDPHLAGTFIPAAFKNDYLLSKLHRASAAAMIGDILNDPTSAIQFHSQVSDIEWAGAVLWLDNNILTLNYPSFKERVGFIMRVIETIETTQWIMFIGRFDCIHKLVYVGSSIARLYELIDIYQPTISPGSSHQYVLLARRRRPNMIFTQGNQVFLKMSTDLILKEYFDAKKRSDIPEALTLSYTTQSMLLESFQPSGTNLSSVMNRYIAGWCVPDGEEVWNVQMAVENLTALNKWFRDTAVEVHRQKKQLTQTSVGVRSRVLALSLSNAGDQMNNILYKKARCLILYNILSSGVRDMRRVMECIESMTSRTYTIVLDNFHYQYFVSSGAFLREFSLPLYAILGHLWNRAVVSDGMTTGRMIHYSQRDSIPTKPYDFPILLASAVEITTRPNLKYAWKSRAMICSILISYILSGGPVTLLGELSTMKKILENSDDTSLRKLSAQEVDRSVKLLWSCSEDMLGLIHLNIKNRERFFLVCQQSDLEKIRGIVVHKAIRIPWTGLNPDIVLLDCKIDKRHRQSVNHVGFDISDTVDVHYTNPSDTGCHCYDCVTEYYLLSTSSFDQITINGISSPQGLEDLHDVYHLF